MILCSDKTDASIRILAQIIHCPINHFFKIHLYGIKGLLRSRIIDDHFIRNCFYQFVFRIQLEASDHYQGIQPFQKVIGSLLQVAELKHSARIQLFQLRHHMVYDLLIVAGIRIFSRETIGQNPCFCRFHIGRRTEVLPRFPLP